MSLPTSTPAASSGDFARGTFTPGTTSPAATSRLPRSVLVFAFACYALGVVACFVTRDYGYYFDDKLHVEAVRVTFESGVLLPRYYHYPSFSYLMSLCAALPTWAEHGYDGAATAAALGEALQRKLVDPTPRIVHDARFLFAAVAHLSLLWSALLAWKLSRSRLAACAAPLVLLVSFEFRAHARIWATDATMAQFVLLSALLAVVYLEHGRRRDFVLSALAAGLAAGTKFPGAMALTAAGTAALCLELARRPAGARLSAWKPVLGLSLLGLGLVLATFLVTTPGAVVDAKLFRDDVRMELRHYRAEGRGGPHEPYGVDSGLDHLSRLLVYLSAQSLSYAPLAALCLFALAVLGLLYAARRGIPLALVAFSVPALYVAYFSYQRLMAVRNFQVLLGFVAVAAGLGAHALWRSRAPRPLRATLLGAAGLALAWNASFLAEADRSIVGRREIDQTAELRKFLAASREPVFLAPHALEKAAIDSQSPLDAKLALTPADAREVVLWMPLDLTEIVSRQGFHPELVRANWPRIYRPLPAGPWEVNYSYYPTWAGDPRPVVIAAEYYRELLGIR